MNSNLISLKSPKDKNNLINTIINYPNIIRLTTFNNLNEEINFLNSNNIHLKSNSDGNSYINDIIYKETNEIIGISGLILNTNLKLIGSWHLILFEPFATNLICEEILQKYIQIGNSLVEKIHVTIPDRFQTISQILLSNGFQKDVYRNKNDLIIYTYDVIYHQSLNTPTLKDENIKCLGCGNYFLFSAEEQSIYHQKEFVNPKRCSKCRLIKKIALKNLKNLDSYGLENNENFENERYTQTLQNICFSWRYKGFCRYGSKCRYIHEDLNSISVLYHLDDSNHIPNTYEEKNSITDIQTDTEYSISSNNEIEGNYETNSTIISGDNNNYNNNNENNYYENYEHLSLNVENIETNQIQEESQTLIDFQNQNSSPTYLPSVLLPYPYNTFPQYITPIIRYEQYPPSTCQMWGYIPQQSLLPHSIQIEPIYQNQQNNISENIK